MMSASSEFVADVGPREARSANLLELHGRLAATTGFDAELDHEIWKALCWNSHWRDLPVDSRLSADPVNALKLARLLSPNVRVDMSDSPDGNCRVVLNIDGRPMAHGRHASLASAIVLAVLKYMARRP